MVLRQCLYRCYQKLIISYPLLGVHINYSGSPGFAVKGGIYHGKSRRANYSLINPDTCFSASMHSMGFVLAHCSQSATGIAHILTVLAFNLLGDGLRDALDPRSTRQA